MWKSYGEISSFMLRDFISEATREMDRPAVNSQQPVVTNHAEGAIRINTRSVSVELPSSQFYGRARDIFYRARQTRMARPAGIF